MKGPNRNSKSYSSAAIKEICLKAGADDAGLVELDRAELFNKRSCSWGDMDTPK